MQKIYYLKRLYNIYICIKSKIEYYILNYIYYYHLYIWQIILQIMI